MNILYIAGYGRSGSSILSRLLAQQKGVISLGEFGRFDRFVAERRICSCSAALADCAFWAPLLMPDQGAGSPSSAEILRALSARDGVEAVIDASKTAYADCLTPLRYLIQGRLSQRPLIRGERVAHRPFYLIQLVRRPDQVLQSTRKGRNRDLERGVARRRPAETLRTLVGWSFANCVATLYRLSMGQRAILIHYEDLLADPHRTLRRIETRFGFSLADASRVIAQSQPLVVGHEIAGNRTLRAQETRFGQGDHAPAAATGRWWKVFSVLAKPIGGK